MLLRDGGLPGGAFVSEYLGELYAAWRWLERDPRTRERPRGCVLVVWGQRHGAWCSSTAAGGRSRVVAASRRRGVRAPSRGC